ncbi:WD repeat-containing protein 93 isoform X3 [Podarcis raffonei]|uniref:WD repeat-containing protein 93 isoform X3 n=1 Tax=Podarcis raffonei TaxID=65483 RepID=UPI0023290B04|nr:WD repeat-containing protein 93 isoform X3 [Podarcis raffonei]
MPVFLRKQPLDIPSPTEKDWIKKDEEEDIYLKDPYEYLDSLPQPYRMINKLVNLLLEGTWEIVEGPQPLQETRQPKVPPPKYPPSSEFQVEGRANCMVAAGEFIFIGFSMGLSVFSIPTCEKPTCEKVCAWEAANVEICAIKVSNFGSSSYLIGSVDELGIARLFYFFKENLLSIKAINEVEDISKRNTCVALELSRSADYAGFLLQAGSSEAWLEIYRLPKDSWLKETENAQNVALTTPANTKDMKVNQATLPEKAGVEKKAPEIQGLVAEEVDPQVLLSRLESRLIPPVLLLKIRSPKPFAPSTFKHPYEALMKIDDGSVIGLGYNHMLKESQWERQEAIFSSTFQQYLETEEELEIKEEKPCNAMFHFHLPGRTLPVGTEFRAEPDMPIALSIHWSRSHNLCYYFLSRPAKEKIDSDPKPDMVWPCASPLTYSAVTPCSCYLAFACEDGTITVWEKSIGFPLSVTVLPDGFVIRSIQFMPCLPSLCEKAPGSSEVLASTKVKLLVLCTDGSLHMITSGAKEFDTKLLGPETPNQTITAIATISSLPDTVLLFFWDGTVILMDTTTEDYISQFIMPPSYKVATSWQPVFSVDTQGQYLLLQGVKQQTEGIFIFDFTTYPFMEAFALKAEEQPEALAVVLPWDKRCNIFLKDSLQRLSTISQQMPECWSLLKNCAKSLAKGESQEVVEEEETRDTEEP